MRISLVIASGQVLVPIVLAVFGALSGLICIFTALALYLKKEKNLRVIGILGCIGILLMAPFMYGVWHN
jgi:hypothetical protein